MDKIQKFDDCFDAVPAAATARKWANICKIVGWIIVGVFALVGIIIGASMYEGGFLAFLLSTVVGFMSAATFWILGAVLGALASSAQSNAETARMTYFGVRAQMKENFIKVDIQHVEQQKKKPEPKEDKPTPHTYLPDTKWNCPNCTAENEPFCNVCYKCGKILEKLDD